MKAVALSLAVLLLAGCSSISLPYGREIEETVLMGSLAIDQEGNQLTLTASSRGQVSAGTQSGEMAVVLSSTALSVSGGLASLADKGEELVLFSHVEQLLLGESFAQESVADLLDLMTRDPQLRLEVSTWIVRDSLAGDLLTQSQEQGGANQRLETLEETQQLAQPRSARDLLVDLEENGCSYLPVISLGEEIYPVGYGIFQDSQLCGYLTGVEAQGFDLLTNQVAGQVVELSQEGSGVVAVTLGKSCTSYTPIFEGNQLTGLTISTSLEGQITEERNLGQSVDREAVQSQLVQRYEIAVQQVADSLQALSADALHWQDLAALTAPWEGERLSQQWAEQFATLNVMIEVEVTLT